MRVHGYCTGCRKIRLVTVNSHGLVKLAARRIVEGICASCEEDERKERMKRR